MKVSILLYPSVVTTYLGVFCIQHGGTKHVGGSCKHKTDSTVAILSERRLAPHLHLEDGSGIVCLLGGFTNITDLHQTVLALHVSDTW